MHQLRRVDRQAEVTCQHGHALHVVRVVVRHEDGLDLGQGESVVGKVLLELADADAQVDEQAVAVLEQVVAVSAAA